jgi:hypothetical protein
MTIRRTNIEDGKGVKQEAGKYKVDAKKRRDFSFNSQGTLRIHSHSFLV